MIYRCVYFKYYKTSVIIQIKVKAYIKLLKGQIFMNKEIRPKYTLRKLSVGLASVMIGSTILLSSQQVHAADTSTTNTKTTDVKNTDTNSVQSVKSDSTSQDASFKTEVTDKSAQNSVNDQTVNDKTPDKQATADSKSETTTQAQPTDNPTADIAKTPIVNEKVNDQAVKVENDATIKAYITAKDKKTGEEYTTSYLGDDSAVSSINLDLIDPNTLEYHVIYHSGDQNLKPNLYIGTANGYGYSQDNLFVDESRMNDTNKLVEMQSGGSHNVIFRVQGTGTYISYDQWLKDKDTKYQGKSLSAWKISDFDMAANDTAAVTIPIKFKSAKTEGVGVIDQVNYWTTGPKAYQSQVKVTDENTIERERMFVPDKPTDVAEVDGEKPAIYNEGISTDPAKSVNNMIAYVYLTGKDLDGNEFVSNYLSPNSNPVDINYGKLDPNSLELHLIYQNNSNQEVWNNFRLSSSSAVAGTSGSLTIDTDRLNDKNSIYYEKSGSQYQMRYKVGNSGETYITYDQWKAGQNSTYKDKKLILGWSGWGVSRLAAGDSVTAVIPVKINLGQNQQLGLTDYQGKYVPLTGKVNVYFDKNKELDFAKPTEGGTFTENNTIPVFYNYGQDGDAHTEAETNWFKTNDGSVAYYLTFKDKNGKSYVTTYTQTGLRLLFDSDMIDRQSINFVGYYENGAHAASPQLSLMTGKDFSINKDQVTAVDSEGHNVNFTFSQRDGSDKVLVDGQVAADKALKVTIPLTYTGNGYTYESHFTYGFDDSSYDLTMIISPKDYDLSKRKVVFLPATKTDATDGMYVPELDQALKEAGVTASDVFFVSNFHVTKYDLFNKDTVPKGPNPTIVYKSSQEFYLLDKIEEVITKHGYTVEFRTYDGKRQPMIFYSFYGPVDIHINNPENPAATTSFIMLMANTDPDDTQDSNIDIYNPSNVIKKYFNTVPGILVNTDKVYDQTTTQTFWDPRNVGRDTGATAEEKAKDPYLLRGYYRADFDSSVELPNFEELEKNYSLDSHAAVTDPNYLHVDITWQATPDAKDVEKLDGDKIDLSRAGYYTITYWHEYGDSKTKISNVGHVTVLPSRKATVIVHDVTDNKDLQSFETEGHVGDQVNFTDLNDFLSDLEQKNYQVDDNPLTGNSDKFTWDEAPLTYVVNVSHKQKATSRTKEVTRTINYQTEDGQIVESKKDTLTFTQTGTKDLVTGKSTWSQATIPSQSFEAVTTPEKSGYTADRKVVPAKEVKVDDTNWDTNLDYVEKVVYVKNQVVPKPEQPATPVDNGTDIIATLSTPEKSGYTADRTVVPKPEQPATPVDNGTDIIATPSTPETTEEEHLTVKDHVGSSTLRRGLPQTGEKKSTLNAGFALAGIGLALLAGMLFDPKKKH